MKTLELSFLTGGGKTATIVIDQPKEPVDPSQVKTAMENIIGAGVFLDSGGNSYTAMKSARLVDRTVTEISLD
ncbi:DUF2922 domain-containing protein [Siminovitchia sp. 179-K 8D1 HS]|uniref:DUF2922 domain-containing protein n=1 Tax=Siminovitchia sp. 179-K 8D1 HS TaxID=3142385 RepID=UPI0039A365E8